MNKPRMYATLVGDARIRRDNGTKDDSPLRVGELVQVEVPPNCAVYAADSVSAKEIARSWFMAGIEGGYSDPIQSVADAMFDAIWNEFGIGGPHR